MGYEEAIAIRRRAMTVPVRKAETIATLAAMGIDQPRT
jgi:hypothetical protein